MRFTKTKLSIALAGAIGIQTAEAASEVAEENLLTAAVARSENVEHRRLENVVVTAQRRKENIQQVPSAVSVVGGNKLVESGVGRSAAEITQLVPNTSAGQSNGHSRPRWWIRGVGTGTQGLDSPSPVGIYLDDEIGRAHV